MQEKTKDLDKLIRLCKEYKEQICNLTKERDNYKAHNEYLTEELETYHRALCDEMYYDLILHHPTTVSDFQWARDMKVKRALERALDKAKKRIIEEKIKGIKRYDI